jgi:beta-1,4-mannosyl-glycoprotein beta-1,4-N-acetylglucosaminyltransferase
MAHFIPGASLHRWKKSLAEVRALLYGERCMSQPRLFDCFPFFNELDLLEVRLRTLAPHVDFFVLGESPLTYRGAPKPLYFAENKARFAEFADRIRHVVIEDLPTQKGFAENWQRETFQRGALQRGLPDARDEDHIMMSDLDEIPRPDKIALARNMPGTLRIFQLRFFAYYANCEPRPGLDWWNGTALAEYGRVKHRFEYFLRKVPTRLMLRPRDGWRKRLTRQLRIFTLGQLRGLPIRFLPEGGHHLSWLGGADTVLEKRGAISIHGGEVFPEDYLTRESAAAAVQAAIKKALPLDETMPPPLREERFRHLLAPISPVSPVEAHDN